MADQSCRWAPGALGLCDNHAVLFLALPKGQVTGHTQGTSKSCLPLSSRCRSFSETGSWRKQAGALISRTWGWLRTTTTCPHHGCCAEEGEAAPHQQVPRHN